MHAVVEVAESSEVVAVVAVGVGFKSEEGSCVLADEYRESDERFQRGYCEVFRPDVA